MVFLILTRSGFDEIRPRIDREHDAVWVNAGVLSSSEIAEVRNAGVNLTDFVYRLHVDDLRSDIDTVREHHPNHVVWVEAAPS